MREKGRHLGRRPVEFGRPEATRDPRLRVLIVCEGECTEPYYFDGLIRDLGLGNVRVMGRECGSAPINVVEHALNCYQIDNTIDRIFCVVDRDEHDSFDEACRKAREAKRAGVPLDVIRSFPSFEFWYLLHFKFSRAPLARSGNRSPGDNAERALKAEFPSYNKSSRDVWDTLNERVPQAIKHAKQAASQAAQDGSENPSTEVHKLVLEMFRLSSRR
jgi:RloB-like protein